MPPVAENVKPVELTRPRLRKVALRSTLVVTALVLLVPGLIAWPAWAQSPSDPDTERATLFWESYGDPAMLGFNLGAPIKIDLFSSSDRRLNPGDRVRHISFIGISPISVVLADLGFSTKLQYFFRYVRETIIVKEEDDKVLVRVRNLGSRGSEFVPLKTRPRVRFLGLFSIGYTFFEERWERGRTASSEMAYRIDLANPRGRESLAAFLGEGKQVSFKPLEESAREGAGVERLAWKTHEGGTRAGFRRARFSSPLSYTNRKMTSTQTVHLDDIRYLELKIARNSEFRKKWGRDRNWRRQFLLQSIADPRLIEENFQAPRKSAAIVRLLTTYQDSYAELEDLQRVAATVEEMTGPRPALDAFADMPPGETQLAFVNLELTLAEHHISRIRHSSEDEVWEILADALLGPEHRSEWASLEGRELWKKRGVRAAFATSHGVEVESRPAPFPGHRDTHERYRFALRAIKKFRWIQDLLSDGDCTSCAHSAFRR